MKVVIFLWASILFSTCSNSQDREWKWSNEDCEYKATLFDSVLIELKRGMQQPINDQLVMNKVDPKERIDFLNRDFNTSAFSNACEVRSVDVRVGDELYFGIIDIGMRKEQKERCVRAVKAAHRQNFNLKVLTRFKMFERENEIVIIYSETPHDEHVRRLLQ